MELPSDETFRFFTKWSGDFGQISGVELCENADEHAAAHLLKLLNSKYKPKAGGSLMMMNFFLTSECQMSNFSTQTALRLHACRKNNFSNTKIQCARKTKRKFGSSAKFRPGRNETFSEENSAERSTRFRRDSISKSMEKT